MNASILVFYTYVILHTCKVQRNLPSLAQLSRLSFKYSLEKDFSILTHHIKFITISLITSYNYSI